MSDSLQIVNYKISGRITIEGIMRIPESAIVTGNRVIYDGDLYKITRVLYDADEHSWTVWIAKTGV